jgi:hypothetical protein
MNSKTSRSADIIALTVVIIAKRVRSLQIVGLRFQVVGQGPQLNG